jgi:hypothetical protein
VDGRERAPVLVGAARDSRARRGRVTKPTWQ